MANLNLPHHKDSRWLQLEVCREAQRNKCTRTDEDCKFAHPPPHVEIQNGRVVACYDSIKGRCTRENPPCKYYHPPQHLKDQLLINGRNHLAMKNILVQQQMQMQAVGIQQPQLQLQAHPQLSLLNQFYNPLVAAFSNQNAYLGSTQTFLPASSPVPSSSGISSHADTGTSSPISTASLLQQQQSGSKSRMDRLEVCREFSRSACRRSENECRYAHPAEHVQITDNMVVVCMDSLKGKCGRESCRYFHPPAHLVQQLKSRQSVNTPASSGTSSSPTTAAANAMVGLPVNLCAPASAAASSSGGFSASDLAQTLQAAASSPLFALLQQQQAMAAMLAAIQSVQASSLIAAQPSINAANAGATSMTLPNSAGKKRKASLEQDSELVFHGLAASVKRQTISPSPLSGSQFALLQQQQQQQQALQAMFMNPMFSNFQQQLSMQPQYHHSQSPGPQVGYYSHGAPPNVIEQQLENSGEGSAEPENPPTTSSS